MIQISGIVVLNLLVPLFAGAFFAFLGLTQKYTTKMKYACLSMLTWVYIILSACGSLLFTQLMEVVGTRVISDTILNSIVLGLIGPGAFLGVISKFTVSSSSTDNFDKHIMTLRDYVYKILDNAILRTTTQRVEMKIKKAGENIDPEVLLKEAKGILGSITNLDEQQITKLEERFSEFATRGDYAPIIRELVQHYDVDHIITRLSYSANQRQTNLQELVELALNNHGQDPDLIEFVIAKVRALQKDPESSLHHLRIAVEKRSSLKNDIKKDITDLRIFIGMTRGKSQIDKIADLKKLIDLHEMTIEDVKDIAMLPLPPPIPDRPDEKQYPTLIAVKRDNGDCVKIVIKELPPDRRNHFPKWHLIEDDVLPGKTYTDLNELARYIDTAMLPIISPTHPRGIKMTMQAIQPSSDAEQ